MGNSKVNNGKRYTMEQKVEALKILEGNDFKWKLTSDQLGIGKATLQRWHRMNGSEMSKVSLMRDIANDVSYRWEERQKNLINRIFDVKEIIVERLQVLATEERNMDNLQKTLKTLSEIDGTFRSKTEHTEVSQASSANIYQEVNQILIERSYEPKTPIVIEWDPE